jgi:hypothetical protein
METFQGIGCGMDIRICKKMKHIRQSVIDEDNRALQVFISNCGTRKGMDVVSIGFEPFFIAFDEEFPFPYCPDPGDMGKKASQLPAGFSFRIGSEPTCSFFSDMVQAALESYLWPDKFYRSGNRTLAVCYIAGIQAMAPKFAKPGIGFLEGLLFNISMGNDLLICSLHQIQQAAVLMKISGIIKHIFNPGVVHWFTGRLLKPVILKALECGRTIAGKWLKPADRTAFCNLKSKPGLASVNAVLPLFPNEGALTMQTLVSLLG